VELLERLLLGPKVLDAGCGGGAYVEYFVRKGYFVTGIDKYKDFLEVDLSLERKGYYVQCDLNEIPLPSKSFDSTYCLDVLEHLDDVTVIKELARVTAKRMVLAVPPRGRSHD
jgi:2-polyprenyl-3-methyl-5-hydroxy-6-metoxy-1,4-benzoquinol methylase